MRPPQQVKWKLTKGVVPLRQHPVSHVRYRPSKLVFMSLEAKEISQLRSQEKSVRWCPSCGYRRVTAKTLHHYCEVCQYSFVIVEATNVQEVRTSGQTSKEATFDVIGAVTVPIGRVGVKELIRDLCGSSTSPAAAGDRFLDI